MNLTCSQCEAVVPEGAISCPQCHASIGTVVLGRPKSLTRSLIGKAVELRSSIPWATESSVNLVDDRPPSRRNARRSAVAGAAGLLGFALTAVIALRLLSSEVQDGDIELTAVEVQREPDGVRAEAGPRTDAVRPASGTAAGKVTPARATAPPALKPGTLSVEAIYKGKTVPARVTVNGDRKGNTPVSVPLGPGKYTVKIEKAGFISAKLQDVQVDSGRNTALKIDLEK